MDTPRRSSRNAAAEASRRISQASATKSAVRKDLAADGTPITGRYASNLSTSAAQSPKELLTFKETKRHAIKADQDNDVTYVIARMATVHIEDVSPLRPTTKINQGNDDKDCIADRKTLILQKAQEHGWCEDLLSQCAAYRSNIKIKTALTERAWNMLYKKLIVEIEAIRQQDEQNSQHGKEETGHEETGNASESDEADHLEVARKKRKQKILDDYSRLITRDLPPPVLLWPPSKFVELEAIQNIINGDDKIDPISDFDDCTDDQALLSIIEEEAALLYNQRLAILQQLGIEQEPELIAYKCHICHAGRNDVELNLDDVTRHIIRTHHDLENLMSCIGVRYPENGELPFKPLLLDTVQANRLCNITKELLQHKELPHYEKDAFLNSQPVQTTIKQHLEAANGEGSWTPEVDKLVKWFARRIYFIKHGIKARFGVEEIELPALQYQCTECKNTQGLKWSHILEHIFVNHTTPSGEVQDSLVIISDRSIHPDIRQERLERLCEGIRSTIPAFVTGPAEAEVLTRLIQSSRGVEASLNSPIFNDTNLAPHSSWLNDMITEEVLKLRESTKSSDL
ncbi:hypothetical protein SeLEV6574_g03231 [Synchytrium endobioticum]|uniref:Uncharacterized protein n=1 Tax=Synchytrium endobioticum TaxID=286115 RepID=A0A507D4N9_9FUNG|nr:hypothetical protein SeLEV6574_g03231 [Synchytrium endobioticum]